MKLFSFFLIFLLLSKVLSIEQLKIDNAYGIRKIGTMTMDDMPIKMDQIDWTTRKRSMNMRGGIKERVYK
nr:unnamed protein product [Meloidogyne enterolobii]CAD2198927.1 unnamed protein product [Meloidogyne enterolobii]